jgi:hypothetical protein
MELLLVLVLLLAGSIIAGMAGAYLGVGGGILLIPYMTLLLGVDIKVAIATSLIGVIATSSGSASVYVRDHLTNLRLGMFLEVATTAGAITGAYVALIIPQMALFVVFGLVLLLPAYQMIRRREAIAAAASPAAHAGVLASLRLSAWYKDAQDGQSRDYGVVRPASGFGISAVAGAISGLLGVGGGFIKVPAMNVVMGVPMKPAVATSNFMIGVTAAASAFIYYSRGLVDPSLAAMIVLGVFTGTRIGTRLMVRARASRVRAIFGIFLFGVAVFMVLHPWLPGVNF